MSFGALVEWWWVMPAAIAIGVLPLLAARTNRQFVGSIIGLVVILLYTSALLEFSYDPPILPEGYEGLGFIVAMIGFGLLLVGGGLVYGTAALIVLLRNRRRFAEGVLAPEISARLAFGLGIGLVAGSVVFFFVASFLSRFYWMNWASW